MTEEYAKDYVKFIRESGLNWDHLSKAEELVNNPKELEVLIRKTHSPVICSIVLEGNMSILPLNIASNDKWLNQVSIWKLSRGGKIDDSD